MPTRRTIDRPGRGGSELTLSWCSDIPLRGTPPGELRIQSGIMVEVMGSGGSAPTGAMQPRPRQRRGPRWLRSSLIVLLGIGIGITVLCALAFGAALRDSAAIAAHPGHTVAEVLTSSPTRALVRYTTPDGMVHAPADGVQYPA
ncbi:MAG: hypothetical protein ACRDRL_28290, partial [Sciscionella sp.]